MCRTGVAVSPGEAIGTFRLIAGIENVCPTLQPDQELIVVTACRPRAATPPMVPVTPPQKLLRSGVQPS